MRIDKKGFFSVDALFAVMLLLLVSTSFLHIYEGRKAGVELTTAKLEAKMVGEKLAAALNTVYANGSYFELRVSLPENVGSCRYQISFENSTRQISVENSAWETIVVTVGFENIRNFTLGWEDLQDEIRLYWVDNQMRVEST